MPPVNEDIIDNAAESADTGAAAENNAPEGDGLPEATGGEQTSQAIDALGADDDESGNDDLPTDKPASDKMKALLDELSGDEPKAAAKPEEKPDDKPADPPAAAAPKTPEQEEAELLEGVKSDRGRERIRQVFAERKQLEQDINEVRELISSTKMSPDEFAQTLEYGRLINSGDEKDLRVALEIIEGQRSALYQRLGVEAPGVDLLAGHEDLKNAVENLEITKERALELAKYRKADQEKQAAVQQQQQTQQQQAQYQKTVQDAAGAMESYLSTRANEVDHTARMEVIGNHFKNPANLQEFVSKFEPHQWPTAIKLMYDGVVVPKAQAQHSPQPLRSRPANLGAPSAAGATPLDRIASRLDSMGI
jgi:hypothetical protein